MLTYAYSASSVLRQLEQHCGYHVQLTVQKRPDIAMC